MKQTFQSAAKFLGVILILASLTISVSAQSTHTEKSVQASGLSVTLATEPVVSTPVYHGGNTVNSNDVTGQSVNPSQTVSADAPAYMKEVTSGTTMQKNGNTVNTVNPDGSVSVTVYADNMAKTTVISKPVMNISQPMGFEMEAYIANYTQWMKANPDFKKFISAEEFNFISQDNMDGLYKTNFMLSQKLSLNK